MPDGFNEVRYPLGDRLTVRDAAYLLETSIRHIVVMLLRGFLVPCGQNECGQYVFKRADVIKAESQFTRVDFERWINGELSDV